MNITENQKIVTGVLGLLLLVSIAGNAFLYQKVQKNEPFYTVQNTGTSTVMTFEGPGFKNEVVTFFDGSQYRTYATSSPLSDSDVRAMREEMEKEFERVNEFFRRQDELFRSLWDF
jgi:DUF4097 and DUF4098 domain-containing protein YvlB